MSNRSPFELQIKTLGLSLAARCCCHRVIVVTKLKTLFVLALACFAVAVKNDRKYATRLGCDACADIGSQHAHPRLS